MKIIILSISIYKEKDAIINAISEEEYLTFKANGIISPTSKNAAINSILTVADVILNKSNKSNNLILKESSVIYSPLINEYDLDYLSVINALAEATNKMFSDEEKKLAFPYLIKAIDALQNKSNPIAVLISYLAKVLKLTGYYLEINHCVRCGNKKDIISFSFEEGGFICKNCFEDDDHIDLTTNQMLLFRKVAASQDFMFKDELDREDLSFILNKLIKFIEDGCGVYLESTKLIK